MDSRPKRRWVETGKTLLILLLSISAVYLLSRTSLAGSTVVTGTTHSQGGMIRPVRLAVTSGKPGRYGVQYDQGAVDAKFGDMANLFSDALAAAGPPRKITAHTFERMLSGGAHTGIYVDLLGAIPCADLPTWIGGRAKNPALVGTARRLLLSEGDGGTVLLSYINELDGLYYTCDTAAGLAERLVATANTCDPNGATFAFEDAAQYAELAPYTLILAEPKNPNVYTASNPIPSGSEEFSAFIRALSFHPQINATYMGDLVREGTDTLRMDASGTVTYYSATAEDPRFPVGGRTEAATQTEMVESAWALLEKSVSSRCGAARLYFIGVKEERDGTALYFGYQLGGAHVQVGSDGFAAKIVVQDNRIASFVIHLRHYTDTGTTSIVLPERQAAAAIKSINTPRTELLLCYIDQRENTVQASWVAQ